MSDTGKKLLEHYEKACTKGTKEYEYAGIPERRDAYSCSVVKAVLDWSYSCEYSWLFAKPGRYWLDIPDVPNREWRMTALSFFGAMIDAGDSWPID